MAPHPSQAMIRPFLAAAVATAVFVGSAFAAATQCLGTTREGKRRKNKVSSGSYCHYHTPAPAVRRCAAKAKDGSPCRNSAKSGSGYCQVHGK